MGEGESVPSPPVDARVSTGSATVDEMLSGGLMARRPYLIVGPAGTGKTTLALQFLCAGARRGEKCLIVTLEEPPNEMRMNHRSLAPDLDRVYVFDAIPDVMRYEHTPFKDIAAVRQSLPFGQVPLTIRKTPELSSVEVTFTALEQTLKMEMVRQNYARLVIDSLTALQYFCMKGYDETLGAQTFLRFLSDLRITTILTVEAPLEDAETPERLLARGEVRLFRWEHDGQTVRAIGVEKFRGSDHDVKLHPYRLAPDGLLVNLGVTISRDTQEVRPEPSPEPEAPPLTGPEAPEVFATGLDALEQDSRDLVALGVDVAPIRSTVLEALAASERSTAEEVGRIVARARGRVLELVAKLGAPAETGSAPPAVRRLRARAASARAGIPPRVPPDPTTLRPALERILESLDASSAGPADEAPGVARPRAPPPRAAPVVPSAVVPTSPPPATPRAPPPPSPVVRKTAAAPPVAPAPPPSTGAPRPPAASATPSPPVTLPPEAIAPRQPVITPPPVPPVPRAPPPAPPSPPPPAVAGPAGGSPPIAPGPNPASKAGPSSSGPARDAPPPLPNLAIPATPPPTSVPGSRGPAPVAAVTSPASRTPPPVAPTFARAPAAGPPPPTPTATPPAPPTSPTPATPPAPPPTVPTAAPQVVGPVDASAPPPKAAPARRRAKATPPGTPRRRSTKTTKPSDPSPPLLTPTAAAMPLPNDTAVAPSGPKPVGEARADAAASAVVAPVAPALEAPPKPKRRSPRKKEPAAETAPEPIPDVPPVPTTGSALAAGAGGPPESAPAANPETPKGS